MLNEIHAPNKLLRIIYADDMRELRDIARITLSREGHLIECVQDGQEALEQLVADPTGYDLLITDHHMPRLDGLGLVGKVRELPFTGKIMVFSSELSTAVSDSYHAHRVDRILFKPVFPSELRRALVELFDLEPKPAEVAHV
jgi:CheY-like chemotaxis protein